MALNLTLPPRLVLTPTHATLAATLSADVLAAVARNVRAVPAKAPAALFSWDEIVAEGNAKAGLSAPVKG